MEAPTHVAHVVLSLEVGGLERVVATLSGDLQTAGISVVVYCLDSLGPLAAELEAQGVRCRLIGRRAGFDLASVWRIAARAREDGVDLLHAHNYGPLIYAALAGRLVGGPPVVYTAHGLDSARRRVQARLQMLRLVDEMVFVSHDCERAAVEQAGVRPRRIRVIHNGIDLDRARRAAPRDSVRRQLGIDAAAPVLGTLARVTAVKRHEDLLDAHRRVRARIPAARCLIVGGGPRLAEMKQFAASMGIAESVIFAGWRSDVAELLSAMDVFVLSSDSEGLSVTLLEAMAQRLPVVATAVGGNPEVVVDGETGFLVPRRDPESLAGAVAELLVDPERRRTMGTAGRERVEAHFSRGHMVEQYLELYRGFRGR